jgi:hypothetical protein
MLKRRCLSLLIHDSNKAFCSFAVHQELSRIKKWEIFEKSLIQYSQVAFSNKTSTLFYNCVIPAPNTEGIGVLQFCSLLKYKNPWLTLKMAI